MALHETCRTVQRQRFRDAESLGKMAFHRPKLRELAWRPDAFRGDSQGQVIGK